MINLIKNHSVALLFCILFPFEIEAQGIGIGKTNPKASLDVNGNIKADSILIEQSNMLGTPLKISSFSDIIDQSVLDVNSAAGVVPVGAWQSFTASKSGLLKNVSCVFTSLDQEAQKTLTIYKGEGINGEKLVEIDWKIPPTFKNQILLKSPILDVNILEGQKYSIHLSNFSGWAFSANSDYERGISYFGGNVDFGFAAHLLVGDTDILKVADGQVGVHKLMIGGGTTLSKVAEGIHDIGNQLLQVSTKIVTINFPTPFTSSPKMQAIVQNETEGINNDYVVTIKSISTTQATLSIRRIDQVNQGWQESPKLIWWAYE
ncbi:MAG TPA: hypothetical protein PKD85_07480 [Saprospiraceae bacterium]|nr:hypothetical protein [Saprospiraceae bacterium]